MLRRRTIVIDSLLMVANDEIDTVWMLPRDLNWNLDIGFRIIYNTASATDTDTHTWIVLADIIDDGSAHAVATTALDTTILPEIISRYDSMFYTFEGAQAEQRDTMSGLVRITPNNSTAGISRSSRNS